MKVDNQRSVQIKVYILSFILLVVIFSIILIEQMKGLMVGVGILFSIGVLWKLSRLRIVLMDVSEHIVSIKARHQFSRGISFPQMEVPLHKIFSCHLKDELLTTFLIVNIHTKNNVRSFYYKLGILSGKSANDFKKALEILKTYKEKVDDDG